MIKRFHEAPTCIFRAMQAVTDGDYALANLYFDNDEYREQFKEAVREGREVILDNGVFELGKAWDAEEFARCIQDLHPTYYIVPDVLENADATIESFFDFTKKYPRLPGKVMGVAQGSSYRELVRCYQAIEPFCDKVCIGFDFSWYQNIGCPGSSVTKYRNAVNGRQQTLKHMIQEGVINTNKPHHLLGVMLPQEVRLYAKYQAKGEMLWIDSIDTSNPVVHGLKGIRYTYEGLQSKETTKLYTLIDSTVNQKQLTDIMWNVEKFRRFCNAD